jgi:hypothetical protein
LYTPQQWAPKRAGFCQLVGKPTSAADALAQGKEELHAALGELEKTLADAPPGDAGAVRLDADGKLVIPPLTAEEVPAEAAGLRAGLAGMLPFASIASLLVELDVRTGFLGGKVSRTARFSTWWGKTSTAPSAKGKHRGVQPTRATVKACKGDSRRVEESVLAKCGFWVGFVSGIVGLTQAIISLVH